MGEMSFLNDSECRRAIVRLTSEATRRWAPGTLGQVDVTADEYFHQVKDVGRVLYPAKIVRRPLEFGAEDLWVLAILPVATGFLGNLLSEIGVETFKALRSRIAQRREPKEASAKTTSGPLGPDEIRLLIEQEAQASGLSTEQIEQLAQLFSNVISELLSANDQRLVRDAGANS